MMRVAGIIPIMFAKVDSTINEKTIHETLEKYQVKVTIKMIGKQELYPTSSEMYDLIKEAMLNVAVDGEIYESDRYVILDDCTETFDNIALNQDAAEDEYWIRKTLGRVYKP
jgi:hypothetical protein